MTPDEAVQILDELGVDGLIVAIYPVNDPRRIALLRVNHACENAANAIGNCSDFVTRFLTDPDEYLADEIAAEGIAALAAKLRVLSEELTKSLPILSKKGAPSVEGANPGLRGDGQAPTRQSRERAPDPPPDDWGDVPF